MNDALRRVGRKAALLTVVAWAPACSGDLGDFCQTDDDCTADLRCSALPGERGVCTYAEGGARFEDAGPEAPSDSEADTQHTADAFKDGASDVPTEDAATDGSLDAADSASDGQTGDSAGEAMAGDSAGAQG